MTLLSSLWNILHEVVLSLITKSSHEACSSIMRLRSAIRWEHSLLWEGRSPTVISFVESRNSIHIRRCWSIWESSLSYIVHSSRSVRSLASCVNLEQNVSFSRSSCCSCCSLTIVEGAISFYITKCSFVDFILIFGWVWHFTSSCEHLLCDSLLWLHWRLDFSYSPSATESLTSSPHRVSLTCIEPIICVKEIVDLELSLSVFNVTVLTGLLLQSSFYYFSFDTFALQLISY